MKKIPLSQGKFALVDDEDFEWLMQWKWHAQSSRSIFYAARNDRSSGRRIMLIMHREILGVKDGETVDHINGDGLDNRRANLRVCTVGQNCMNRRFNVNNKSGFKGVSWYKNSNKWNAQIGISGKKINLGYFTDLDDAVNAYNEAAKKYFGEFYRGV